MPYKDKNQHNERRRAKRAAEKFRKTDPLENLMPASETVLALREPVPVGVVVPPGRSAKPLGPPPTLPSPKPPVGSPEARLAHLCKTYGTVELTPEQYYQAVAKETEAAKLEGKVAWMDREFPKFTGKRTASQQHQYEEWVQGAIRLKLEATRIRSPELGVQNDIALTKLLESKKQQKDQAMYQRWDEEDRLAREEEDRKWAAVAEERKKIYDTL